MQILPFIIISHNSYKIYNIYIINIKPNNIVKGIIVIIIELNPELFENK